MAYNDAHHLELHLESFNTLNTPQFSNRARVPLKITATKIDNREFLVLVGKAVKNFVMGREGETSWRSTLDALSLERSQPWRLS